MAERSVTYLFDVLAWRASRPVQRMTWAQRGMYREMLDEQRDKGSLPDDPRACAELLGGTPEEWLEHWPVLRRNFVDRRHKPRHGEVQIHDPADHDPKRRIVNIRMARTLRERRAYLRAQQVKGQKGGLAKARNRKGLQASSSYESATANSSLKKREEESSKEGKGRESTGLAYDGRFLTVFRWQLSELGKRLAEQQRADFDLLGWFPRVEAELERSREALPQEQHARWTWLLDRLYTDAVLARPNLMGREKRAGAGTTGSIPAGKRHLYDANVIRAAAGDAK